MLESAAGSELAVGPGECASQNLALSCYSSAVALDIVADFAVEVAAGKKHSFGLAIEGTDGRVPAQEPCVELEGLAS